MLRIFHKLMIPVVLLLAAAGAATAAAAPPAITAHAVMQYTQVVGQPEPGALAVRVPSDPSGLLVLFDGGSSRAVTQPAGCLGLAAGSGHLVFRCGESSFVITTTTGADPVTLDLSLPSFGPDGAKPVVTRLGDPWLLMTVYSYHSPPSSYDVNWRTGAVLEPKTSPTSIEDPDTASLVAPLCSPLRRTATDVTGFGGYAFGPIQYRPPYALIETLGHQAGDGPGSRGPIDVLQRCGRRAPVRLPAHFRPSVLGDGWVAGSLNKANTSKVGLVRLADGRRFVVGGVRGVWSVAMTDGRVYLSVPATSDAPRLLWAADLPKGPPLPVAPVTPAKAARGTLTAHRAAALERASGIVALGPADRTSFAWYDGSREVVVIRSDAGQVRTTAPPQGCGPGWYPQVVGGGHIAWTCNNDGVASVLVTDLAGAAGRALPLSVSGNGLERIGASWAQVWLGCTCTEPSQQRAVVNLATGMQRPGPGRGEIVALDDPVAPVHPLCAPVLNAAPSQRIPELGAVTVHRPWLWVQTAPMDSDGPYGGPAHVPANAVYRCGSRKPITLPKAFDLPTLGYGWLAEGVASAADGTLHVNLLRLSDRRAFHVDGVPSEAVPYKGPGLAFTRGRLYATTPNAVWTVKLPAS